MILDSDSLDRALSSATDLVKEYAGGAPMKAVIAMLDALVDVYMLELIHAPTEAVQARQVAIKQAVALRDVIAGAPHTSPRL